MTLPRVTLHATQSIDGATIGFPYDIELHYDVLEDIAPQAMLVGSTTGISASRGRPAEDESLRRPPTGREGRPWWVIPDSKGVLEGRLHAFRLLERFRDVIIFMSEAAPDSYRAYLDERGYQHYTTGARRVDLRQALELLHANHGVERLVSESGGVLSCALLEAGLVDQVSLLFAPSIVGVGPPRLFRTLPSGLRSVRLTHHCQHGAWLHAVWEVVPE